MACFGGGFPDPLNGSAVPWILTGPDEFIDGDAEVVMEVDEGRACSSTKEATSRPAASAARTFFNELSSVPVVNRTG
jgi:hypothetical protein